MDADGLFAKDNAKEEQHNKEGLLAKDDEAEAEEDNDDVIFVPRMR